jgi:PAS domain-containing protein
MLDAPWRTRRLSLSKNPNRGAVAVKSSPIFSVPLPLQPALQLIYDTAPIGLAFLFLDCRYLQINQRLTEICGISLEDLLARSVLKMCGAPSKRPELSSSQKTVEDLAFVFGSRSGRNIL